MRSFISFLLAAFLVVAVSACELFTTKIAPAVSKAVIEYCKTPAEVREAIRAEVNAAIKPNTVEVTCVSPEGVKSK